MCARMTTTQVPMDEQWETTRALVNRSFLYSGHQQQQVVLATGLIPWPVSLAASGSVTRDARRTASVYTRRNCPVAETCRMDTLAERT